MESPARAFIEWIDEGPVDGRQVRRMRDAVRTGVRFFGSPAAWRRQPRRVGRVSTDQLIEMMFFPFPSFVVAGFHFMVPKEALATHRALSPVRD
ncbi:MAG: hypothetical protein U0531_06750 [Dehalococcoidia bacterium]